MESAVCRRGPDLGLGVELCWPRVRNKKIDRKLVGWVKGSFFKQRRFLDDADLLAQLAEWHIEVNTHRPRARPASFPRSDWRRSARACGR